MKTVPRAVALVFAFLATLIGCGSGEEGGLMEYDGEFAERVRELRSGAESAPLKDLVPGDWTTVHIILGPHTEEWVERAVGAPLPESKYGFDTEGNILVFMRGQEVVQIKGTTGRLMGEGYFSSEVVLRGTGSTIDIDDPTPPQPN
ncbi:hypothetical protein B1813_20660 [Saccharomonospora piscinae]|uniref:Lipoprotein n=2 Tax=Saccharomonospora piscinae TaxID=687388 RepID=A0A1V8ZX20_SACPI|nr:hypothetical protein B1813_20660 [Saccharomonospora piscinae]